MRIVSTLTLAALCAVFCSAQKAGTGPNGIVLRYDQAGSYHLTERSDWARYDNGKYIGHIYREVRGSLNANSSNEYSGSFYVLEETLRDLRATALAIDEVKNAAFRVAGDGSFFPIEDNGFPTLRGFPSFPAEPVSVGDKWTARFTRAVDPKNTGKPALLPLISEFVYRGEETYKDIPVRRISAKYATRYRGGASAKSALPFTEDTGTHEVDILIHALTGRTVLIRDRLDETFRYPDNSTIRFKGFTITFAEGSLGAERGSVIAKLKGKEEKPGTPETKPLSTPLASEKQPETVQAVPEPTRVPEEPFELAPAGNGGDGTSLGITVEETDAGVKLTVKDLRFAPDSEQLLPEERERLEVLARSLKSVSNRTFLVEGHTAAVGKSAGELDLSKRRAKRIVDELVARGISADRFLYKGWGGTKPIASNADDDGRARNRRVEITILD